MTKTAIITVGLPASGKSTTAAYLTRYCRFVEVNLDDCREHVSGDASNQECTPIAVAEHKFRLGKAIALGQDIVVSDTNLNAFFRAELIAFLEDAGYEVDIRVMEAPLLVCLVRNAQRERYVPVKAYDPMYTAMVAQGFTA